MAERSRTDLCILGAGALGLALAKHARSLGASVVLVDRGSPEPGDAPDRALRVAALQSSAAIAHSVRVGARFGLGNAEPKVSFRAIADRVQTIAAERAPLDSVDRLAALGVDVVQGAPRFADPMTLMVGDRQIRAQSTILALGATPAKSAIVGLDGIDSFDTDSILGAQRKLSHLLVIGNDSAGFVLGQSFARLGSQVTIVPQGPAFPGFDTETAAILSAALLDEGVRIIDGGSVSQIQPRSQGIGVLVSMPDGETVPLDISHVLVAMGGQVDLGPLAPDLGRIKPGRSGSFVHGDLGESSNRRVRLVGAAAGIDQWHHAQRHGRAVVEALLLGAPRHKLAPMPRLIPTEPALVEIGRPPARGRSGGDIHRASFIENEKALALGQGRGLAKVAASASGMVTNVSIVGPQAGELASLLVLAMERGISLDNLADLSLPYPSLGSIISSLGENYLATRSVSPWTARRRKLRRIIPL